MSSKLYNAQTLLLVLKKRILQLCSKHHKDKNLDKNIK